MGLSDNGLDDDALPSSLNLLPLQSGDREVQNLHQLHGDDAAVL